MKRYVIIFLCIFCLPVALRARQDKTFGIGLILIDPTGINAKYFLNADQALNFGLGWHYYYGRYYYDDSRCYDPSYYRNHRTYCDLEEYDPRIRDYNSWIHFHADYLFHNFKAIKSSQKFGLYYGPGLAIKHVYRYTEFGVRGNFGITWLPQSAPLDIFFELAPVVLMPNVLFDIDGCLGIRFWF